MIISNYCNDKNILILSNGGFGNKWIDLFNIYNITNTKLVFDDIFNFIEIENIIKKNKFDNIFFVHHETTRGIINNIDEINIISKKYNIGIILDCVSSFGCYDINLKEYNIDFFISSSNKCLMAMPGLSIVVGKKTILEKHLQKTNTLINYYLNLNLNYEYSLKYETLTTTAINLMYCLNECLETLVNKTLNKNFKKTEKICLYLRNEMKKINYEEVEKNNKTILLTNYYLKKSIDIENFINYFETNNIIIYRCKNDLYKKAFQIANMGNITKKNIDFFISILKKYELK